MFTSVTESLKDWLIKIGLSQSNALNIAGITDFLMILVISVGLYYLTKYIIIRIIKRIASKTSSIWDDVLIEKKVFNRLAFLIPGILLYQTIS